MRKALFLLICSLIVSTCLAQTKDKTLVEAPEPKIKGKAYTGVHALLVGIDKYPNLPKALQLAHAVNDAVGLSKVLAEQYGFADVTLLTDQQATLSAIRTALSAFADNRKINPDDLVLVYFSGHGQTVPVANGGAMGFLIPSDAKVDLANPTNSAPYLDTCLPMKQVWDYLDLSPAKHAVVIADACFSGLMARTRGVGPSTQALDIMLARRARQVITAGSGGQKTAERDDIGHGVFTAKLIDELKARSVAKGRAFTLSDLFASLQEQVSNATDGKQTPQMGNFDSEGEVVFVPSSVASEPVKAEPVKPEPVRKEIPKPEPKKEAPKTDPPKTEPVVAGKVPQGLSKKQGEYYLRLQGLMADAPTRFANLARKGNRKTTKPNGPVDAHLYELAKSLPGFGFGGVTDPSDSDVFAYFEGTPVGGMQVFADYKAAIRALLPGGREQHFDDTNWRISDGNYQISLRREREDTWRVEQVYQTMTLTILKVR